MVGTQLLLTQETEAADPGVWGVGRCSSSPNRAALEGGEPGPSLGDSEQGAEPQ